MKHTMSLILNTQQQKLASLKNPHGHGGHENDEASLLKQTKKQVDLREKKLIRKGEGTRGVGKE